jgi:hypothetical protein
MITYDTLTSTAKAPLIVDMNASITVSPLLGIWLSWVYSNPGVLFEPTRFNLMSIYYLHVQYGVDWTLNPVLVKYQSLIAELLVD